MKMLNKLKSNIWKQSIIISMAMFLWSCWGWNWGSNVNNTKSIDSKEYISWKVQLWEKIKNSVVNISYSWKKIYTVETDNNWNYIIPKKDFDLIISQNGLTNDSLLNIEVTDIITENEQILGNMSLNLLNENLNWAIINSVSSFVNDLLSVNNQNLFYNFQSENGSFDLDLFLKSTSLVSEKIGIWDVNWDWVVSYLDTSIYDIEKREDYIESYLNNNWYITSIYDWDIISRQSVVKEKLKNINLVFVTQENNSSYVYVKLKSFYQDSELYYSYDNVNWLSYSSEIYLENWNSIYFKEKYIDWNFSNIEKYVSNYQDLLFLDSFNYSYTPEYLWTKEEIESQISELEQNLSELQISLSTKQWEKSAIESNIESINNQINDLKNTLNSNYNWLNSTLKDLVSTNKTEAEKNTVIDNELWINSNSNSMSLMTYSSMSVNSDLINGQSIQEWINILNSKISDLNWEISDLETEVNNKKSIYDNKYNEYLVAKEEYENDREEYLYRNNRYEDYTQIVDDLNQELSWYNTNKNLADSNYKEVDSSFPKQSDYPVSDYTNSDYENKITIVSKLNFTYRWKTIKWYFQFSSKWWFPWKLWIEKNWTKLNEVNINSADFLNAIDDLLAQAIKYKLDFDYYQNLYDATLDDINSAEENLAEAQINRLLYWLIQDVNEDIYKYEEEDYLKAKSDYDSQYALLQPKFDLLDQYNSELSNLLSLQNNIDEKDTDYQEAILNVNDYEEDIQSVLSSIENNNVDLNNLENSLRNYNDILELKIWKTYKRFEKSVSFDETKYSLDNSSAWNIPENYIFSKKNTIDYQNYPFTVYVKLNRSWNWNIYPALVWIEYKSDTNDENIYSTVRIEVKNKEHMEDATGFLVEMVKERISILNNLLDFESLSSLYEKIVIASNKWFYLDSYNEDLDLSREELESLLEFFAGSLFEYNLKYDSNFKENYENEYNEKAEKSISLIELTLWRALTDAEKQEEIKKALLWTKEWIIKATRDYLMQYIDLVNSLSELSLSDISSGMKWVWNYIKNPIDNISSTYQSFKDGIAKVKDKLDYLWAYEYTYGTSYIWSTLWFISLDPAWKILKLWKLWEIVEKIDSVVLWLIDNLLNSKIIKLWTWYVQKIDTLSLKVINSFDVEKQERFFKRMSLMDDTMLKEYLDNPQKYVDNFEVWGTYNMLVSADETWKRIIPSINDSWLFINNYWGRLHWTIDFIVTKNPSWEYWINFWLKHSYLSNWDNLFYAWWLQFKNWILLNFTNWSWHYRPSKNDLDWINATKQAFKKRMNIDLDVDFIPVYN